MLDNRKLLFTVTALAIAGVLGLIAYSTSLGAIELNISEINSSHEGCAIITSGTVTSARTFSDGSASLTLSEMNTSASVGVYIPADIVGSWNNTNAVPGTVVRVAGELSFYLELPEITISKAEDITVIAESGTSEYGLGTVMGAIGLFNGMETTTSGQITDMEVIVSSGTLVGTSFRLKDVTDNQTYYLECICYDRDLTETHSEWDSVRATGVISYYQNGGYWQMVVDIIAPA